MKRISWAAVLGAAALIANTAHPYVNGHATTNAGAAGGMANLAGGKVVSDVNRYINYVRSLAPVSHWGLASSTKTETDMMGLHNGTWVGAPEQNAGLIWGFSKLKGNTSAGTNACQVTSTEALKFTTGMTMSLWLSGENVADQCMIGKYDALFSKGYGIWIVGGTGKAECLVCTDVGYLDVKGSAVISGTWEVIHLVATYQPTKVTLYVNGAEDAHADDLSTALATSDDDLFLGKEAISPTWFYGYFQEATLWNRALTATEIANLNSLGRSVLQ